MRSLSALVVLRRMSLIYYICIYLRVDGPNISFLFTAMKVYFDIKYTTSMQVYFSPYQFTHKTIIIFLNQSLIIKLSFEKNK
jgi:hypothetical protein